LVIRPAATGRQIHPYRIEEEQAMRGFIRLTLLGLCLVATDAAAWTSMAPVTNAPRRVGTASNRVGVMSQFNLGDVFVGVAGGQYYHYTNGGAYLETLQQPQTGFTTGCI